MSNEVDLKSNACMSYGASEKIRKRVHACMNRRATLPTG
jgi:hypothetical protein